MVYFFYFILTTPLWYWLYLGFTGNLGVEPLETLSVHTGFVTITLLLLNLWLGVAIFMFKGRFKFLRWWFQRRRSLGVAAAIYVILHFLAYLAQEGFARQAWEQIRDKTYLTVAFGAFIILMLMLMTSNDFSVKKLGFKNWKRLHRFVHFASLLILVHVLLIEKANIPLLLAITVPIIPFQLWRFFEFGKNYLKRPRT
jgi:methionine sulfoxide reductase heme-binding subunit